MKTMNILFTGAGRRVELIKAFREAAFRNGYTLRIHAADMSAEAPVLVFCDRVHDICAMGDAAYIPSLLRICEAEHIDLLIPTIDTDLLVLSEQREAFAAAGTRVLISSPDFIRVCRDKNRTGEFFRSCGLKAPETVHAVEDYRGSFPAFIKPKDGSSSVNAFVAEDEKALAYYAGIVPDYVIQPRIEGEEYTVDICCDFEGRLLFAVPRCRLRVRAGEVQKTRICMDERMIHAARAIADQARPCGPVTVQLIRERATGEDYFIEINPRFGGGAPVSVLAGADSPAVLLKLLSGEDVTADAAKAVIADGAVYNRFDDSILVAAGEGKLPVRGVIFDLDDTLCDEREYVRSGFRAVGEVLGQPEAADRLYALFEEGQPAIDAYLAECGMEEKKEECLRAYREHLPEIRLRDGAEELLKELRAKGIRTGILTDGRPEGQRAKIKALGLEALADDIIVTDELGGAQFRKPCDIGFRILQRRWQLPFAQMLYTGDNPAKDFLAPAQLGMQSLLFRNPAGLYRDAAAAGNGRFVPACDNLRDVLGMI